MSGIIIVSGGPRLSGAPPSRSETPEKPKNKKRRRGKTNSKKRNPEFSISTEWVALVHLPVLPHATGDAERGCWVKSLCITKGEGEEGQWQEVRLEWEGKVPRPCPLLKVRSVLIGPATVDPTEELEL